MAKADGRSPTGRHSAAPFYRQRRLVVVFSASQNVKFVFISTSGRFEHWEIPPAPLSSSSTPSSSSGPSSTFTSSRTDADEYHKSEETTNITDTRSSSQANRDGDEQPPQVTSEERVGDIDRVY